MLERLDSLDPDVKAKAMQLILKAAHAGIPLRITQAYRTLQEQAVLYAQGRQSLESVNVLRRRLGWSDLKDYENRVVTHAAAGQSWHNFRRAFDVVPMHTGVPDWLSPHWEQIGELGESVGLEWGGRWQHKDMPHFQDRGGLTLAEMQATPSNG